MKSTYVKERAPIDANNPILIEGLPGLGLVGKIAIRYLVKQFKAKKFAYLYSPHFPYFVLVNKKGNVRLLRGAFYYVKNAAGPHDIILFTGDSQSQTIEGQYDIAEKMLSFAKKHNVGTIVTIGGYRMETEGKPKVVVAGTDQQILDKAMSAGAVVSETGSPIVGTAGLILGLARFKKIDALCMLGETRGYLPDPLSARSVIEVIKNMFNLDIDLAGIDQEINKADRMVVRLQKIEETVATQAEETRKEEDKKTTYIS
ncbi:MAG: PAC2 family protein [Candidatus Bathyarchaeota archaeon]|nr:PAC2 family protein [Candidatus Bathyarchaeota archaeon]